MIESDIAKSSNWKSLEDGWRAWVGRDLLFSVRLYRLLKAVKAKGILEGTCRGETKPTPDEAKWAKAKVTELKEMGIDLPSKEGIATEAMQWFQTYLDSNPREGNDVDFAAFERQHRLKLPKPYKDFIAKVGPKTFIDADSEEGVQVQVLALDQLDLESYRKGQIDADDEESNAVDGIMFAKSQFGDCYCFDVRKRQEEYPVYVYLHEMNCFEAFAPNFVECLRRLTRS